MGTFFNSKVHVLLLQGTTNQSSASILGCLPPFVALSPGDLTPLASVETKTGYAIIGRKFFPTDLMI